MKTTEEILRFERWQRRIFRLVKKSEGLIRMRQLDYSSPSKKGQRWPIYLLEIHKSPRRLFNREAIFNPPRESRKGYLKAHRALL